MLALFGLMIILGAGAIVFGAIMAFVARWWRA
jgi:hypothetical protein